MKFLLISLISIITAIFTYIILQKIIISRKVIYRIDSYINTGDETHNKNKKQKFDFEKFMKRMKARKKARKEAMDEATRNAIRIPIQVMTTAHSSYLFLSQMADEGNPNSLSDVGVGAQCVATAIYGAYLNVKINCQGFDDAAFVTKSMKTATSLLKKSERELKAIKKIMDQKIVV